MFNLTSTSLNTVMSMLGRSGYHLENLISSHFPPIDGHERSRILRIWDLEDKKQLATLTYNEDGLELIKIEVILKNLTKGQIEILEKSITL